jgi:PAS domain S-box-containing protein
VTTDPDSLSSVNALRQSDIGFQLVADSLPQMLWSALPDGFHDYFNRRWYEFTGLAEGSTDGDGWLSVFDPDHQAAVRERWAHCLSTGDEYEMEYRLRRHDGEYRWVIGRANAIRAQDGRIVRWIGTCTDIDDAKRQAEHDEIMSRELSHRIKNIFAVISGLIGMSARHAPESKRFADELRQRIAALGRAHEFARPHSEQSRVRVQASTLHGMLREMLSPYPALDAGRIVISGDDLPIDDRGATPLALVFHELATNSAKYGALSVPDGRIEVATRASGDDVIVDWTEQGGPVVAAPDTIGFGTRLVEISVVKQLGGTIDRQWNESGLVVRLTIQPKRLIR